MIRTALASLLLISTATLANEAAIESSIVLQTSAAWDGRAYAYPAGTPQLTVRKVVLQPGAEFPWHSHPMPAAGYVLSGTLEVESQDGKHRIQLRAGEALAEMQGIVHRGRSGDSVTELVVFYAGAHGLPIAENSAD